jgi:outer membrane protein assembly factor BamB
LLGACAASLMSLALTGCWSQIGFGPEHRRHNPFEQDITAANVDTLAPVWSVDVAGDHSEPVVANGRVHFNWTGRPDGSYNVEGLDAATGDTLWSRALLPSSSSFLIANSSALSGDELWASYIAQEGVAQVRLDPATGATIASDESEIVVSSVVTAGDVLAHVRVGAIFQDRDLVVRDRATLATLWTATIPDPPGVASIAIADGQIYVQGWTGLSAYAVAGCGASTCGPIWERDLAAGERHTAMAAGPGGTVVTTTAFRWVVDGPDRFADLSEVVVRDGATGEQLWFGEVTSATGELAIDDAHIYVPSRQEADDAGPPVGANELVAFAADGCGLPSCTSAWSASMPGAPGAPLVAGDVVYVGVGEDLHALGTGGAPLATLDGAGVPRSLAGGRLYTSTSAAGGTTLHALAPTN